MSTCTWAEKPAGKLVGSDYVRCGCPVFKQWRTHDVKNEVWAELCEAHSHRLADAMLAYSERRTDHRGLLSVWIKAQGGAKAAASRM